MAELWFWIVSVMVALYVVLDGFDFGAGILHLLVAKTDEERRTVLAAIGPLWDGNEVWLLAGGGALFAAFPKVLAAGFSGFYLAMFLVVWALLLRGISIEFRSHVGDGLWRSFWDVAFAASSALLPVLLGAALGNVLRGVPLDASGAFNLPLFTHGGVSHPVGILDWYTVLVGLFALVMIAGHGALFLAWKTEGPVQARSASAARGAWLLVGLSWGPVSLATGAVSPALFDRFPEAPLAWLAALLVLAGVGLLAYGMNRGRWKLAFFGSCGLIVGLLAGAAAMVFPDLLRSTLDPTHSLNAWNAASPATGLRKALVWWLVGFPLAALYFANLFRLHRGKAKAAPEGEGY